MSLQINKMSKFNEVKLKLEDIISSENPDDSSVIKVLAELGAMTPVSDDVCTLIPMIFNNFIFSDKQKIRETAVPVFSKLQVCLAENLHLKQKNWWTDFKLGIEKCCNERMLDLMKSGTDEWPIIWCILARMVGEEVNASLDTANALLRILEKAFKSKTPDQDKERQAAFDCWRTLIDGFVLSKGNLSKRRLDILLIPLKAPNHLSKTVCEAKLQTWMYLVTEMGLKNESWIDIFVPPLIEFLYNGTKLVQPAYQLISSTKCASEFLTLVKNSVIFRRQYQILIKTSAKCIESIKDDASQLYCIVWCSILDGLRRLFEVVSCDNNIIENTVGELVGVLKQLSYFPKSDLAQFIITCTHGKNKLTQLKNYYLPVIDIIVNYDVIVKLDTEMYDVLRSVLDLHQPKERTAKMFNYVIDKTLLIIREKGPLRPDVLNIITEIWLVVCDSLEESAPWVFSNNDFFLLYDVLIFPVKNLLTENGWCDGKIFVRWKDLLNCSLKTVDANKHVAVANEIIVKLTEEEKFILLHPLLDIINCIVKIASSCNVCLFFCKVVDRLSKSTSELNHANYVSAICDSILKYTKKNVGSVSEMLEIVEKLENITNDSAKSSVNKNVLKLKNTLSSMNNTTPKKTSKFLHRLAKAKELEFQLQSKSPGSSPQSIFDVKNIRNSPESMIEIKKNSGKKTPSACRTPKKPVEEDSQEFVIIPPKPKTTPLTEHQKETMSKRKCDIPALYHDLSQQDSQTTDRIEINIAKCKEKTENILKNSHDLNITEVPMKQNNSLTKEKETVICADKKSKINDNNLVSEQSVNKNVKNLNLNVDKNNSNDEINELEVCEKLKTKEVVELNTNDCNDSVDPVECANTGDEERLKKKESRKAHEEHNQCLRKSTRRKVMKISPQKLAIRKKIKTAVKMKGDKKSVMGRTDIVLDNLVNNKSNNCVKTKSNSACERKSTLPSNVCEDSENATFPESFRETCSSKLQNNNLISNALSSMKTNDKECFNSVDNQLCDVAICLASNSVIENDKSDNSLGKNKSKKHIKNSQAVKRNSLRNNSTKRDKKMRSEISKAIDVTDNKVHKVVHEFSDVLSQTDIDLSFEKPEVDEQVNVSVVALPVPDMNNVEVEIMNSPKSTFKKTNKVDTDSLDNTDYEIKIVSTPVRRLRLNQRTQMPKSPCVCCDSTFKKVSTLEKQCDVKPLSDFTPHSLVEQNNFDKNIKSKNFCHFINQVSKTESKSVDSTDSKDEIQNSREKISSENNSDIKEDDISIMLESNIKDKAYVDCTHDSQVASLLPSLQIDLTACKKRRSNRKQNILKKMDHENEFEGSNEKMNLKSESTVRKSITFNDNIDVNSLIFNNEVKNNILCSDKKICRDLSENHEKDVICVDKISSKLAYEKLQSDRKADNIKETPSLKQKDAGKEIDINVAVNIKKETISNNQTIVKVNEIKENEHISSVKIVDIESDKTDCVEETSSTKLSDEMKTDLVSGTSGSKKFHDSDCLKNDKGKCCPPKMSTPDKQMLANRNKKRISPHKIELHSPKKTKKTDDEIQQSKTLESGITENEDRESELSVHVSDRVYTEDMILGTFDESSKSVVINEENIIKNSFVILEKNTTLDSHISSSSTIKDNSDLCHEKLTKSLPKCSMKKTENKRLSVISHEPVKKDKNISDQIQTNLIHSSCTSEVTSDEKDSNINISSKSTSPHFKFLDNWVIRSNKKKRLDSINLNDEVTSSQINDKENIDRICEVFDSEEIVYSSQETTLSVFTITDSISKNEIIIKDSVDELDNDLITDKLKTDISQLEVDNKLDIESAADKLKTVSDYFSPSDNNTEDTVVSEINHDTDCVISRNYKTEEINDNSKNVCHKTKIVDNEELNNISIIRLADTDLNNSVGVTRSKFHVCRQLVNDLTETFDKDEERISNVASASDNKLTDCTVTLAVECIEDNITENKENYMGKNAKVNGTIPLTNDDISDSKAIEINSDIKLPEKSVSVFEIISNKEKKSFKRPDILHGKQKNLELKQNSSLLQVGSKCKQQLFNTSPEKSTIIENQNSSPQSARGRTAHLMELVCGGDTVVARPTRVTTPRRLRPSRQGYQAPGTPTQQEKCGILPGEKWVCKTYSPYAVPSPGILKVKQDDTSPPPSKKKRVNFHDPPVSRSLLFAPKEFGRGTVVECIKNSGSGDDSEEIETQSQGSMQLIERTTDNKRIIWPSLIDCNHPISCIILRLIGKEWAQDLENNLLSMDISTVGKLSSLTESVVDKVLPIKSPKVERLRNALKVYESILLESKDKNTETENVTEWSSKEESKEVIYKNEELLEADKLEKAVPASSENDNSNNDDDTNINDKNEDLSKIDTSTKSLGELLHKTSPQEISDLLEDDFKITLLKYQLQQNNNKLLNTLIEDSEFNTVFDNSNLLKNVLCKISKKNKHDIITSILNENSCDLKDIFGSLNKGIKNPEILYDILEEGSLFKELTQNRNLVNKFYFNIDKKTKSTLILEDINTNSVALNDILQKTNCDVTAESMASSVSKSTELIEMFVKKTDFKTCATLLKLLSQKMYESVANESKQ
ncbi:uncharacterized protein LOC142326097 [Lycorma delicatula]|uniref:uncharacterized protein LOC142326097 n=1 Tax=Lycorma delicatula TaxID=130591 RepID=UPI003F51A9BE